MRKKLPLAFGSLVIWNPSQRVALPMLKQSISEVLLVLFIVWEPGMPSDTETNGGSADMALIAFISPDAPFPPDASSGGKTSSGLSCDWTPGKGPISTVIGRLWIIRDDVALSPTLTVYVPTRLGVRLLINSSG